MNKEAWLSQQAPTRTCVRRHPQHDTMQQQARHAPQLCSHSASAAYGGALDSTAHASGTQSKSFRGCGIVVIYVTATLCEYEHPPKQAWYTLCSTTRGTCWQLTPAITESHV
jgi:hypothetical protein